MKPIQIGQRIRDFRKQRNLTQEALAEAADISASYLSHIEVGARAASLTAMLQIADALDITLDQLLYDSPLPTTDILLPEIQTLLESSTVQERRFLFETVKAMKQSLRDNHLVG